MALPSRISREPKPGQVKRVRSPGHLKWVRSHGCCVPGCHGSPIEAAHVRTGTDGCGSIKPGDNWTISLCAMRVEHETGQWIQGHHREQHQIGEAEFERKYGIDMKALAREFAARSPFRGKWR